MPINIDKPLVLAANQTIQCVSFSMNRDPEGWTGTVQFQIADGQGVVVDTKMVSITRAQWNQFWSDFNTGSFLYESYIKAQGLPDAVPPSIESDFTNKA